MRKKILIIPLVISILVISASLFLTTFENKNNLENSQGDNFSKNTSVENKEGNISKEMKNFLEWLPSIGNSWKSEGQWKSFRGSSVHNGQIKNDNFKLNEDSKVGHFGIRFEGKMEKLKITTSVSDLENGKILVYVGTEDLGKNIRDMIYSAELKDKYKYEIVNEGSTETIDLNWGQYSFIKFKVEKISNSNSPKIKDIELKKI